MTRAPPVLRVALAFALGAAFAPGLPIGIDRLLTPALLLLLLAWTWSWRVPASLPVAVQLLPGLMAGYLWAGGAALDRQPDCIQALEDRSALQVGGYFSRARTTGASRFRVQEGLGPGCRAELTVYLRGVESPPEATYGRLEGRWLVGRDGRPGYVSGVTFAQGPGPVPLSHRLRAGFGDGVGEALARRFGDRAAVARALTIAGGDGVDPHLREAFVRSGVAHLLSISGFHVGIVASLLAALTSITRLSPRGRATVLAGGVWIYVLLIGVPTSAARAAWMTSALVLGTLRGWPVLRLGALGFAMLVLAVLQPVAVAGPGYQLTVAGTAGILILGRWIVRHWPSGGWLAALGPSVGAGLGAALFTAPILAIHFGALSTVSVPASLVLTPLVAVAIPGILLTVFLDRAGLPGAGPLAYATDGLLLGVSESAQLLAALPWASIPVTGADVAIGLASGLLALRLLRVPWRTAPWARACLALAGGGVGLVGLSLVKDLAARGTLEISAIDVGQGDAIAIRTPRNRWYLVDGGPRSASFDAGASRVVPYLHRRGVRRIEAIVLSHPDADHVGGLAAVIDAFPVGAVLGPGRTVGQGPHLAALTAAIRRHSPWRQVVTGDVWSRDDVRFRVLHPGPGDLGEHPNDWSVVLSVHFGEFDVLLMGDAEEAAEARALEFLGRESIEVLKVGHHGSRTSTTPALLTRVAPRVAMISAGRRNRYGHPAEPVLRRLAESGASVLRTDQSGTVSVIGRRDGTFRVRAPSW